MRSLPPKLAEKKSKKAKKNSARPTVASTYLLLCNPCATVSNITFQVIDVHFLEWLVPALEPSVPCLNQPARGLFSGEAKNKVCYFGVIRGCLKIRILQQTP